jgi:hypothetical protein
LYFSGIKSINHENRINRQSLIIRQLIRALLVEDEAIIVMEVESQLQSLGYKVTLIVIKDDNTTGKIKATILFFLN